MNPRRMLAVVLCTLMAASCTSQSSRIPGSGSSDPPVSPSAGSEIAERPELAFASRDPVLPDVLRLALARPASLRPVEIALSDQAAVIVADLLYDGLTEAPGAGETGLASGLALEWVADEDLTRWSFQLDTTRTSLPAGEVAAQFRNLLDDPPSPAVAALLADVDDVAAVSDSMVDFVLRRPNAGFPWLLSSTALGLVGEGGAPTGRYLVEVDEDAELVLVAGAAHDELLMERIEIRWADSAEDAYRMLTLGLVDAAVAPAGSMGDARNRFGAVPGVRSVTRFYGMNAGSANLADERLRWAVLTAVDRDRIALEVSSAPALVADGVLSPALAGYEPGGCAQACTFDLAVARDLVAQVVGGTDGVSTGQGGIVLSVAYGADDQRLIARALADDLEAAGLRAQLLQQSSEQLAGTINDSVADLFAFGWVAPAGSLDAVVPALLHSDSPTNGLGLSSPEVDRLIEKAASTADDEDRWALLNQAHRLALADHRVLPLTVATSYFVPAPQAAGLETRADGSIVILAEE